MRRYFPLLAVGCVIALASCSHGPVLSDVEGVVTINGKPLQNGSITFEPADGRGFTTGATIANGNYKTEVPPGDKKVRITGYEVVGQVRAYKDIPDSRMNDVVKDVVPSHYNNNTELKLTVKESATTGNFELTSL